MLCHSCNPAFRDPFDFAEDEARSAELVQAILLSYLFSCILLNLSAFPTSFMPISGSTPKHNFLFLSYILFYFGVLPNLYLILRFYLSRTLSRIVTTPGYFRILSHRSLWSTTTSITLGYYHIYHFGVLPHRSLWGTTTSFTFFWLGAGYYH